MAIKKWTKTSILNSIKTGKKWEIGGCIFQINKKDKKIYKGNKKITLTDFNKILEKELNKPVFVSLLNNIYYLR